ncbi:unnamed protein product [Auanema sp. JU1783]|nr:unnamed protein product [Auanema sp. JU1783]
MTRRLTTLLLLSVFIINQITASLYWDEFEACKKDEDFGNKSLVCDPSHRLAASTRKKLTDMLTSLQTKIGCECIDGCRRDDGRDGFIGVLHVSTSKNSENLEEDVREEYANLKLGNASCDHGLVLVYMKDTQKLATYRGGRTFVSLTDEDMQKLHTLAAKGPSENDALALQFLLSNYKDVIENPVQRSETWVPLLGLIAAVLIVLIILGILLAVLLARFCCCCVKRKKDVYHVNTLPSYKTIEPLYVVTPTGMPPPRALSDAIYSTPYSGSPLPFPPPPGSAVPLTPSSAGAHRIRGDHETPIGKRHHEAIRSEPGSLRRIGDTDNYAMPPPGPDVQSHIYGTIPRATLSPRAHMSPKELEDLQWLDPKRKQETQTREELIY